MADRQIFVIDDGNHSKEKIRKFLAPYDFEIKLVEADENGIQMVKTLKPDAVFVAAQNSEKSALAFCSKAKKAGGGQIPVILITDLFSKSDIELHSKQRYHPDAYLQKKDILQDDFLQKMDKLINLGKPNPNLIRQHNEAGKSDKSDIIDSQLAQNQKDFSVNSAVEENTAIDDNWKQLIKKQEKEVISLQSQLDKAIRAAKSTPFADDYVNLREEVTQKEKEIIRLQDKLDVAQEDLMIKENALKELEKLHGSFQKEKDEFQDREKELLLNIDTLKGEVARVDAGFEKSVKQFDLRIEKLTKENLEALKHQENDHAEAIKSLTSDLESAQNTA